jgi:hypothetical protein
MGSELSVMLCDELWARRFDCCPCLSMHLKSTLNAGPHFAPKKRDHDEKRRAGGMECGDTGTRVNELIHLVFKRHKKLEVL